jgi:hypothetical protein
VERLKTYKEDWKSMILIMKSLVMGDGFLMLINILNKKP